MYDESQRDVAEAILAEEARAELTAEAFSTRMRIGLLLITMLGEALMVLFAVKAMTSPMGMLDENPFLAVYLGGILVGMGFFLMVMYGGLVANNPRLTADGRIIWYVAFTFIGPIALPAYWFIHVWPAPHKPWTDPAVLRRSMPAPAMQPAHAR
jgi:hypothetical protein